MLPIGGKPILAHILDAYRSANVRDLVVVRGYAKQAVNLADATYVDNDAFATTGELASLACAKASLDGPCLLSYGDVVCKLAPPGVLRVEEMVEFRPRGTLGLTDQDEPVRYAPAP